MEAFLQAAAEFVVTDLELKAEPSAVAAAQRSLDESGLLLLGEVHGVMENPLLIRALMQVFGSPRPARTGARYGSMSAMTRFFSTCPQPAKRSCPSDLSRARPGTTHPDGG